jgi:hypothetical protein
LTSHLKHWASEGVLLFKIEKKSHKTTFLMIFITLTILKQVNRMLKPDIWQALSDSEGKVSGFRKALKLVVLGVCCYSS